jgi:hypothetical protein
MIATSTMHAGMDPSHARSEENRTRPYGAASGSDPMLDDLLAEASALSMELAGSAKAWAGAGEWTARHARRLREAGKGSPVYDLTAILYRLARQRSARGWVIAAHIESTLIQATLPMTNDDLVRRYFDLNEEEEPNRECEENKAVTRQSEQTWNPDALERADLSKAGTHMERRAVVRELKRRSINPHEWRRLHS